MPSPSPSSELNAVWLDGTVLGCPQQTEGPTGRPVFRFRLATSRCFHQAPGTAVFQVEAPAEALAGTDQVLGRGSGVRVVGQLRRQLWRDRRGDLHEECTILGRLVVPRVSSTPAPETGAGG